MLYTYEKFFYAFDLNTGFHRLSVFPNPTAGNLTIQLEGTFTFSLVDLNGKTLVIAKAINQTSFDLSEYANGIYFVHIQSENGNEVVKVVKQ